MLRLNMFTPRAKGGLMGDGKRFRKAERRLDAQGWLLIFTFSAVLVIGSALLRKGVLSPKDLLADG
jgi:hypothetical protein